MENFSVLIRFELSEKRNTINKKGQLFRDWIVVWQGKSDTTC